jgi:hypothetical protein
MKGKTDIAQEIYRYQRTKYNTEGIHVEDGSFFLETIKEWERNFHNKHPYCYADYLFANNSTMILLNRCFDLSENETCGMDLIDGQIDLDTSLEIGKYSPVETTYAIGSDHNEDEPLMLIIDNKLPDGVVILKYLPENDSEVVEIPVPVEKDVLKLK